MRRGFTLVEIIISIGLIVLIGTISIFSFNLINKHNKEKTLESMSETIFNAVNVYLESNSDIKNQLYNNKNGLKIPLTTLENSGLVDFGELSDDLDSEDFVVTMLGSTNPNDDTCANTYTAKSWNITSGETIYICEKSNGSQNLVTVAGQADNLSKVTREPYIFKGNNPRNYIKYSGNLYRIMYIDIDDSLMLYSNNKFTDFSESQILPIDSINNDKTSQEFSCHTFKSGSIDTLIPGNSSDSNVQGINATIHDIYATGSIKCVDSVNRWGSTLKNLTVDTFFNYSITNYKEESYVVSSRVQYYYQIQTINVSGYKIRLKPCMEIVSGTGAYSTPYILKNNCS